MNLDRLENYERLEDEAYGEWLAVRKKTFS
jgi:hypothetical protein